MSQAVLELGAALALLGLAGLWVVGLVG